MSRAFIKKEGIALVSLSRYLLTVKEGERLRTIEDLSDEFSLSVGVVQNSMKVLESAGSIRLERRGRNGTVLTHRNMPTLLQQADFGNLVCAMPLPYTRLYEGLASGLKQQFTQLPLYFAHMRGAGMRIDCLIEGMYDMAVASRLAADSYLLRGEVLEVFNLGAHSYVDCHQLICRQGEYNDIQRVGFDANSPDQRLLNEIAFAGREVEWIETPYNDCLHDIEHGVIDAAIWNIDNSNAIKGLEAHRLEGDPRYYQATEAVILVRNDNVVLLRLLNMLVDVNRLLAHQHSVVQGDIEPRY